MTSTDLSRASTAPDGLPDEVITCLQNARFVSFPPITFKYQAPGRHHPWEALAYTMHCTPHSACNGMP
jgi:hypothetical protein